MQGINHYCQTIQALNVSTQYKNYTKQEGKKDLAHIKNRH